MALSLRLSQTQFLQPKLSLLNRKQDKSAVNVIAKGGATYRHNGSELAHFHEHLSSLQVENFSLNRISVFEEPLFAELEFCPGRIYQSLFSKVSKPTYQLIIRHNRENDTAGLMFKVKKLSRTSDMMDKAFTKNLQRKLTENPRLSYCWVSRP